MELGADTNPIVAFDLGGTWFRSAVVSPADEVLDYRQVPAASVRRLPDAPLRELQQRLVEYLVTEGERLVAQADTDAIAVSIGAAIDARSGLVIGASPLWGATDRLELDLHAALAEALPDPHWTIVNDVTAAAFGVAMQPEHMRLPRLAVLTVSSGLAMRTIEPATGRVPVSEHSGLQGELGHLPATFALRGKTRSRRCDCGGRDHLSAFSSGRAIEALLAELADEGCAWLGGSGAPVEELSEALAAGSPEAHEFLDAVTAPLARALLAVLTIDAEVERIVLTGGVVDGLGERYMASLHEQMATQGLYGSRLRSAGDFADVVQRAPSWPSPNMRGAARCARLARRTEVARR